MGWTPQRRRWFHRVVAEAGVASRRTFLRLDGVSQHVENIDGVATAIFPGGSPNGPAGEVTFLTWVRCDHAVGEYMYLMSASATGEAQGWLFWAQEPAAGNLTVQSMRRRYAGGTVTAARAAGPLATHPWVSVSGEWRLSAAQVGPSGHRFYFGGQWQVNSTVTATDPAIFIHPIGKRFVIGEKATASGVEGIHPYAGDIRAPAIYESALSESQLQAIEAAGPTYDHAAAGAAGWWPGDGDTYPTLRNLGSAGSAWDLALKNGSQAMIMEE